MAELTPEMKRRQQRIDRNRTRTPEIRIRGALAAIVRRIQDRREQETGHRPAARTVIIALIHGVGKEAAE